MARRLAIISAVILVGLATVAAWRLWGTSEDLRAGSERVEEGGVDVASRTPQGYEIVYLVEERGGDERNVSTDRVRVRRPFDLRVEVFSGAPPGEELLSSRINTFARLATGGGDAQEATFAIPPGPTTSDRRLGAYLDEALDAGVVEAREARRILGRVCRVYRGGGLPGQGLQALEGAEHVRELCLDEAGLVLEELGYAGAGERLLTRRVAVEVTEEPIFGDDLFEVGEPSFPVDAGGGSVRPVDPSSRPPGTFYELEGPPEGFEHRGRYAVVPPQEGFDDPIRRDRIVTLVVDVFVRGPDALVVERGQTLGGVEPFEGDPSAAGVEIEGLGRGEMVLQPWAARLRVRLEGGRFLTLKGTVAPAVLERAAERLEEVEGGSLVYLDDEG